MDAFDSCEKTDFALAHVLSVYADAYTPSNRCSFNATQINLGLLGPASSDAAVKVADFMAKAERPILSFGGESLRLSNREKFPTFRRTVPPLRLQIQAIADLVLNLNWKQVALVYSNSSYGREGKNSFLDAATKSGICVSNVEILPTIDLNLKQPVFDRVAQRLIENLPTAAGVVVVSGESSAIKLLETFSSEKFAQNAQKLQLIFADSFERKSEMLQVI